MDTPQKNPAAPAAPALLVKSVGVLLLFITYLLPRKFGTVAVLTDASGFFPENYLDYIWITWPAHSFGFFSGAALLLVMLLKGRCHRDMPRWHFTVPWLWSAGLLAAVLPGFFGAHTDKEVALAEFIHFAALGAWVMAVWFYLEISPRWGKALAAAFLTGSIFSALGGYHQYLFGFEQMRAHIADLQAKNVPVQESLVKKLADTRITGTLASSNAFACLLAMLLPLAWYFGGEWGKKFEPAAVSIKLFRFLGIAILFGALVLTRSRSAILALAVAAALAIFSYPKVSRRWKILTAAAMVLVFTGTLIFAIKMGRGVNSMMERADYLRTSAIILGENPLCGSGWGGFFYRHMMIKNSFIVESARDPHNMVAAFAGQCGLLSGILALAALLLPLILLWKRRFSGFAGAVFWCGVLFSVHIMVDSNMHNVTLMAGIFTLYAAALLDQESDDEKTQGTLAASRWSFAALCWLCSGVLIWCAVYGNWHHLAGEKAMAELMDLVFPSSAEQYCDEALIRERFTRLSHFRPHNAVSAEIAGDWFLRNKNLDSAQEFYHIALARNPRRPATYRRLADTALLRGEQNEWRKMMAEAAKRFPRNPSYQAGSKENRKHTRQLLDFYYQ